jgi:HEAT repeats
LKWLTAALPILIAVAAGVAFYIDTRDYSGPATVNGSAGERDFAEGVMDQLNAELKRKIARAVPGANEEEVVAMSDKEFEEFAVRVALADRFVEELGSPDPKVRLRAVVFLAALEVHPKKAVPALEKALKDDDPKVRQAAAEALKKIKAAREQKQ